MNIHYTCNALEFSKEREEVTKLAIKDFFKKVGFFFFIGLSLFIYGIFNYDEYSNKMTSTHEDYGSMVEVHNNYTNWHIAESLGILILFITLYLFRINRSIKKYYQEKLNKEIVELKESGRTVEVKINETFVSVKRPSIFLEIEWHLFDLYTDHDEYLILKMKGITFNIVINKKKITNSELQSIFEQLQKHQIKK